ncbi:MAG: hypothetical protein ACRDT6_23255 [Micromonosporaceae bacterium]
MTETPDPEAVAVDMLRMVSQSGFGIISAIQAQARALDDLIGMITTNPHLDRPGAAATLEQLRRAQLELDEVYDMALDATVATWSITEVPHGLVIPDLTDPLSTPDSDDTPEDC